MVKGKNGVRLKIWGLLSVIGIAGSSSLFADRIRFDPSEGQCPIDHVIVLGEEGEKIEYIALDRSGIASPRIVWVGDRGVKEASVDRSSAGERAELLARWGKQSCEVSVKRRLGPALHMCAVGVRYPLPVDEMSTI